jgi:hypothetical protein
MGWDAMFLSLCVTVLQSFYFRDRFVLHSIVVVDDCP